MWELENSPYLPCFDLPYGRITSESKGRDDSMSIAMGFIGKDGIVLATDSYLSIVNDSGNLERTDDNSQKLWQITPFVGCTSIGSQEGYRKWLIDQLIKYSQNTKKVDDFDKLCGKYINIMKDDHLRRIKGFSDTLVKSIEGHYIMRMLIGGYDKDGTPRIISVDSSWIHGLPFTHDKVTSYRIHGADNIGEYWMKRFNLQKIVADGLEVKALKRLAVFIINETSLYFPYVGGRIQLATITGKVGFKNISDEVKDIKDSIKRYLSPVRWDKLLDV
jgi:20S proteasome alpha/beta subunit